MPGISFSSHKSLRAVALLENLIARLIADGRKRLPTVVQLSKDLHASTVTIAKALRFLQDQGVVRARPGRGIWIVSLPDKPTATAAAGPQPEKLPRWLALKKQISDDILGGIFPPGRLLPLAKELCSRYNVSFRPLQQALSALAGEHRIIVDKKRYRVFQTASQKPHKVLIALAEMDKPGQIANIGTLSTEFWHALERECRRLAIDLELYTVAETLGIADNHTRSNQLRKRQKRGAVAGYLVWLNSPIAGLTLQLFSQLAETRKNVSVLTEEDAEATLRILVQHRRFRLFSPSLTNLPGKMVGNHLLGSGHHRVACFSPQAGRIWSQNRIESIVQTFESAGLADAVVPFTADYQEQWDRIFLGLPGPQAHPDVQTNFLKAVQAVNPGVDASDPLLFHEFKIFIWRQSLAPLMRPLFDRALLDKNITAWVGVTDDVARCALDYLAERGIGVPFEISVIGFDDTSESMAIGLTSYNFNMTAVAMAMLDHILDGRTLRGLNKKTAIEIPGLIMERASTAQARSVV